MSGMGPSPASRRPLGEAFFRDRSHAPRARIWVLPLGPVVLVWAVAVLWQQGERGWMAAEQGGPLAGSVAWTRPGPVLTLGGGQDARRLRLALALLARGEPGRARTLLQRLRYRLGDRPLVLRPLARAEQALGHRERAADLYVVLLQERVDDIEALEFFLRYRYEADDLDGALAIADELRGLGALQGASAHLADRIRAERAARDLVERLHLARARLRPRLEPARSGRGLRSGR